MMGPGQLAALTLTDSTISGATEFPIIGESRVGEAMREVASCQSSQSDRANHIEQMGKKQR
jgi:hypothetical protein